MAELATVVSRDSELVSATAKQGNDMIAHQTTKGIRRA
jgi:hypothetical protein